jgi:hypothetical protein
MNQIHRRISTSFQMEAEQKQEVTKHQELNMGQILAILDRSMKLLNIDTIQKIKFQLQPVLIGVR